jgi:hypothetical protein
MPKVSRFLITTSVVALAFTTPASVGLAHAQDPPVAIPTPAAAPAPAEEPTLSQVPRTIEATTDHPQGEFPPPPPRGASRTISGALSLGPGWLSLHDDLGSDGQAAMGFAARVGMVVAPELNLVLGIDRTSTDRDGATFSQTAGLLGVQLFFVPRAYVGGALGLAWVAQSGIPDGLTDGPGVAISATLGVEALRRPHWALTVELTLTRGEYELEAWEMGGLRLGLSVF